MRVIFSECGKSNGQIAGYASQHMHSTYYVLGNALYILHILIHFDVIQSPDHVQLFVIPWTAAGQASLSFTISWSLPKFMSISSVMPSAISSSDALFSFCPQSFPASGTFLISQLFASDNQNTGVSASASVLPVNIQGWSLVTLTGLISLLSKGLSGVFSNTQF